MTRARTAQGAGGRDCQPDLREVDQLAKAALRSRPVGFDVSLSDLLTRHLFGRATPSRLWEAVEGQ